MAPKKKNKKNKKKLHPLTFWVILITIEALLCMSLSFYLATTALWGKKIFYSMGI